MRRPTISNQPITLRARRISPTRPARLVGPSRLLRRDEVRNPHTSGPRDQSFERRGACRNHRCHHAKRRFKPFPATGTAGSSDRVEYSYCHDDDGVIQPDIPSSVYFPDIPCGSLAPLVGTAYTCWLIGAKEESQRSGVFGELIPDACHRRGIQLELQNGRLTGNRNLRRARCRTTWSKIGAAQHPGTEQRAIIPGYRLI
jgi:hypothetical protein